MKMLILAGGFLLAAELSWRAEGPTPETFEFREAVLSTPNLVGVFTGHFHVPMNAHIRGQNLFSVVSNGEGEVLDVQIG